MATHKSYQLPNLLSRELGWGKVDNFSLPFVFYNLLWIPFRFILKYFFRLQIDSKENLAKLEGPLIIVSNHGSWVDSFLIGICFPFRAKVSPIRYAVWWKYYYIPLFTPLLWLMGNFPVRKGAGLDKTLAYPINILKKEGVVGIFPTGRRVRVWDKKNPPPKAKRGVAYLALKTHSKILPIKIEGNIGMNFLGFLTKRYKIKIKIGKRFYLPHNDPNNLNQLASCANIVMDKIADL